MKNRTRISYTFLLLAIGIVSTILSNPILAQTEGNSQNQTSTTSGGGQGQQGGQQTGNQTGGQQQQGGQGTADDIGSIQELQKYTKPEGPLPKTSNDTT